MDTKYISKPVWAVPTSISVPARPSLPRACKPPPGDGLFDDTSTESGSVNYSISQESNTVEDDPFETDDSITTEWRSVDTTPPSSPAYSPTSPAYSPPTYPLPSYVNRLVPGNGLTLNGCPTLMMYLDRCNPNRIHNPNTKWVI